MCQASLPAWWHHDFRLARCPMPIYFSAFWSLARPQWTATSQLTGRLSGALPDRNGRQLPNLQAGNAASDRRCLLSSSPAYNVVHANEHEVPDRPEEGLIGSILLWAENPLSSKLSCYQAATGGPPGATFDHVACSLHKEADWPPEL
jgi:hypothetical protein